MADNRESRCKACKGAMHFDYVTLKLKETGKLAKVGRVGPLPEPEAAKRHAAACARTNAYRKTPHGKAKQRASRTLYEITPRGFARRVVWGSLMHGYIVKGPCEVCGAEKVDGHHDDYSKPSKVRWLCRAHHAEWHRTNTPRTA